MRSVSTADQIRVVIDETSFDFRALEPSTIEFHLDDFNEAVWSLREDGVIAWKPPALDGAACTDSHELFSYLVGEPGELIDRDTKRLFFDLIDKCSEWDYPTLEDLDITITNGTPIMAWSIAYALTSVVHGQGVACLVFPGCDRRGFVTIGNSSGQEQVFFFAVAVELKNFWRSLYGVERIDEVAFFTLAPRAFPALMFNPSLSFRRFEGTYLELLPDVVKHLSVLNDHFLSAYHAANGIPYNVQASLGALGCNGISPESPNTRRNERAMRQRDVNYNDQTVRCEWHAKIEPHRNRIHFAFGDDFQDKIFIGIFVDHLDT